MVPAPSTAKPDQADVNAALQRWTTVRHGSEYLEFGSACRPDRRTVTTNATTCWSTPGHLKARILAGLPGAKRSQVPATPASAQQSPDLGGRACDAIARKW